MRDCTQSPLFARETGSFSQATPLCASREPMDHSLELVHPRCAPLVVAGSSQRGASCARFFRFPVGSGRSARRRSRLPAHRHHRTLAQRLLAKGSTPHAARKAQRRTQGSTPPLPQGSTPPASAFATCRGNTMVLPARHAPVTGRTVAARSFPTSATTWSCTAL